MQEVDVLLLYPPSGADAIVAQLRGFVGCIPALENHFKLGRQFILAVGLEPARFDQAAAEWSGCLLVLTGKVVFALGFADVLQNFQGLPIRV
jgi:hypothetical protein